MTNKESDILHDANCVCDNCWEDYLKEFEQECESTNLMEIVLEDESAYDQACKYGNRCGGHAVYCNNNVWEDAPRKCRRTWYTGGLTRDEDCEGYTPND